MVTTRTSRSRDTAVPFPTPSPYLTRERRRLTGSAATTNLCRVAVVSCDVNFPLIDQTTYGVRIDGEIALRLAYVVGISERGRNRNGAEENASSDRKHRITKINITNTMNVINTDNTRRRQPVVDGVRPTGGVPVTASSPPEPPARVRSDASVAHVRPTSRRGSSYRRRTWGPRAIPVVDFSPLLEAYPRNRRPDGVPARATLPALGDSRRGACRGLSSVSTGSSFESHRFLFGRRTTTDSTDRHQYLHNRGEW